MDSLSRRVDNFTTQHDTWNSVLREDNVWRIPSLPCGDDLVVKVDAGGPKFSTTTIVKSRDTVRCTLGPSMSSQPVYLPCGIRESFGVKFVGGSGDYSVLGGGIMAAGGTEEGIGPPGFLKVSVPGACIGDVDITVLDNQLVGSGAEMVFRLKKITGYKTKLVKPILVINEWIEVNQIITFEDGTVMDSASDGKWFEYLANVLGLHVHGMAEMRLVDGRVEVLVSTTGKHDLQLRILDGLVSSISTMGINKAKFLTSFPWKITPGSRHELALTGMHVDVLEYQFESSFPSIVTLEQMNHDEVVMVCANTVIGETNITVIGKYHGIEIFQIFHPVSVLAVSGLVIAPGDMVIVRNQIARFSLNFEQTYPPTKLISACKISWSFNSADEFAIHQFDIVGTFPIKAVVTCPHMHTMEATSIVTVIDPPRIYPYRNIVGGPVEEFTVLKLSQSEVGIVKSGPIQFIQAAAKPSMELVKKRKY